MEIGIKATPIYNQNSGVKRWLDICGATFGLILFCPLFLLIAFLQQLEIPGKVFYRQERVGRDGKRFWLIKFRTMRDCSGEDLDQYFRKGAYTRLEYEIYQKTPDDPRVTRVGRLLRRSSLDELPQLWNVLRGEMSLVGPRPFLPEQLDLYGPAYVDYQKMAPGMTGLWQISGRNKLTFQERVRLDEKYVREWNFRMDIKILLMTPWVVLSQRGAF